MKAKMNKNKQSKELLKSVKTSAGIKMSHSSSVKSISSVKKKKKPPAVKPLQLNKVQSKASIRSKSIDLKASSVTNKSVTNKSKRQSSIGSYRSLVSSQGSFKKSQHYIKEEKKHSKDVQVK